MSLSFDKRVFVDKLFEEKLLKNISDKVFKMLKEHKKVKNQSCYIISQVYSTWVFCWIPYSIRTKITHNWTILPDVWFSLSKFELNINFSYQIIEETKEKVVAFNYSDTEKDKEILKNNLVLLKNEIENLK